MIMMIMMIMMMMTLIESFYQNFKQICTIFLILKPIILIKFVEIEPTRFWTKALFDDIQNILHTHTHTQETLKMMKLYTRMEEDFLIFNIYKKWRK